MLTTRPPKPLLNYVNEVFVRKWTHAVLVAKVKLISVIGIMFGRYGSYITVNTPRVSYKDQPFDSRNTDCGPDVEAALQSN